jgi:hypothetical protein
MKYHIFRLHYSQDDSDLVVVIANSVREAEGMISGDWRQLYYLGSAKR